MARRTTRDKFKRKLDSASLANKKVEGYLLEMLAVYNDTHPDIGAKIILLLEANEEFRKALEKFNRSI